MNPVFFRYSSAIIFSQICLVTALMILVSIPADPALANEAGQPEINVSATGKVSAEPDMVLISFGVVREAKTARDALTANNKAMSEVLSALENVGIAKTDIQTSNFNISPRYHYPKRSGDGSQPPPKITGYMVSNNVSLRVRDLSKTGELLDQVVTLGVNSGGNIQFLNQNTDEILKNARTAAVKNAIKKANTLANAAGVKLGQLIEIRENSQEPRPVPMARTTMMESQADGSSVPIAGGENSYSVNVNMRWVIEQ